MAVVYLGNHNAIERRIRFTQDPAHRTITTSTADLDNGEPEHVAHVIKGPDGADWWPETTDNGAYVYDRVSIPGKQCTEVRPPDGLTYAELIHDLSHAQGIWQAHSDDPTPAWVASDDPKLAELLGALWGIPVREPEGGQR